MTMPMTKKNLPRSQRLAVWAVTLMVFAVVSASCFGSTGSGLWAALALTGGAAGVAFWVWSLVIEQREKNR